jgi:PadR family transcriptional regulator, regulatory protein AphA
MLSPLSTTSYVILGMLSLRPMSGYDIKHVADMSVRYFWTISYGQIYPELKNLADAGLVSAEDTSVGSRQRTVYRLTKSGEEALGDWVGMTQEMPIEIRDEMLLRLFFADQLAPDEKRSLLNNMAGRHNRLVEQLRSKPEVARTGCRGEVLEFGIAFHEFCTGWFTKLAEREEVEG